MHAHPHACTHTWPCLFNWPPGEQQQPTSHTQTNSHPFLPLMIEKKPQPKWDGSGGMSTQTNTRTQTHTHTQWGEQNVKLVKKGRGRWERWKDKDWDRGERAGTNGMSSCPLLALHTWCDSYQAGVSACVFTSADQLRVCPHIIVPVNMFFQAQVELFITWVFQRVDLFIVTPPA